MNEIGSNDHKMYQILAKLIKKSLKIQLKNSPNCISELNIVKIGIKSGIMRCTECYKI